MVYLVTKKMHNIESEESSECGQVYLAKATVSNNLLFFLEWAVC